jgi:hypothetical protein
MNSKTIAWFLDDLARSEYFLEDLMVTCALATTFLVIFRIKLKRILGYQDVQNFARFQDTKANRFSALFRN